MVFLALVCLGLFLPGLFHLPPTDRDEARFAQASKQMLESGDYVDIRFQDKARHKKPVGVYWLQAASTALFGGGERDRIWTYRIPSLLAAVAAVLLTAWLGARMFGASAGMVGGIMLAGSILLGVEARLAKTDATLLAAIVVAQAMLATVYLEHRNGRTAGWRTAILFWLAIGAGILVKGPLILLVSGGTALALVAADRQVRWLRALRPLTGVALALFVALPWFIAIGLATDWAFYKESLGRDLFAKLASGQESHGAPPGFYLVAFWITFWPFSLFAALAAPWAWRNRHVPEIRFCLAWIVPAWLVMEIVATKLPHYVLPAYPAIALLAAAAAASMPFEDTRGQRIGWWVGAVGFVLVTVALAAAFIAGPYVLDGEVRIGGLVAGAAALALLVLGLRQARGEGLFAQSRLAPVFLVTLGVFYAVAFQLLVFTDRLWPSVQVAAALKAVQPCPNSVLAASGYTEPSLVFLVGTDTRLGSPYAAAAHLMADRACAIALVTGRAEPAFLKTLAESRRTPRLLRSLNAINYARGKPLELRLYTLAGETR
jgi:4-amino-4-deoxy-L-arabinose transferase-like glycosyltransferase